MAFKVCQNIAVKIMANSILILDTATCSSEDTSYCHCHIGRGHYVLALAYTTTNHGAYYPPGQHKQSLLSAVSHTGVGLTRCILSRVNRTILYATHFSSSQMELRAAGMGARSQRRGYLGEDGLSDVTVVEARKGETAALVWQRRIRAKMRSGRITKTSKRTLIRWLLARSRMRSSTPKVPSSLFLHCDTF